MRPQPALQSPLAHLRSLSENSWIWALRSCFSPYLQPRPRFRRVSATTATTTTSSALAPRAKEVLPEVNGAGPPTCACSTRPEAGTRHWRRVGGARAAERCKQDYEVGMSTRLSKQALGRFKAPEDSACRREGCDSPPPLVPISVKCVISRRGALFHPGSNLLHIMTTGFARSTLGETHGLLLYCQSPARSPTNPSSTLSLWPLAGD